MAELDRPTESEAEAEEFLRSLIEHICGNAAQAEWHLWMCRERALKRIGSTFMGYLATVSAELPLLLTDPELCRNGYVGSQVLAALALNDQEQSQ